MDKHTTLHVIVNGEPGDLAASHSVRVMTESGEIVQNIRKITWTAEAGEICTFNIEGFSSPVDLPGVVGEITISELKDQIDG